MSDETQFGLLLHAITELSGAVDRMRGEIMARLDRHGDELSAIHEDIIVNFGATDHVRRGNLNTREELRLLGDQVNAMTRQILRLQTEVRDLKRE
jgi:hypothetical protein